MVGSGLLVVALASAVTLVAAAARAEILIGTAGPMTGKDAWFGEQMQRGAELAAADLNAAGGVLGEPVQLITVDDFRSPEQAVAAARKLVSEGVTLVIGHYCSHASIPASEVYEEAGMLQISPASTNPQLTELGRANVFRVVSRDDTNGVAAGNYLADHYADQPIAILHDGTIFGQGLADETRKQLDRRGVREALLRAYVPGGNNYSAEIAALQEAGITVCFVGGYHTEIALLARTAHDRGYPLQLVAGLSLASEDFGLLAGEAAEGTLFIEYTDPRGRVEALPVVERFRAAGFEPEGYTLLSYGAVQVWAQAVQQAGTLALDAVIRVLREQEFDTVLGPIDFDDKGDLTEQNPLWYVWRGGAYQPLEPDQAAD
jgi:branched-chain amino acid transport system substrate-binding protein